MPIRIFSNVKFLILYNLYKYMINHPNCIKWYYNEKSLYHYRITFENSNIKKNDSTLKYSYYA